MPAIEAAYRGCVKKLKACFGGGDKGSAGDEPAMKPATPKNVLAVFKSMKGR